MDEPMMEKTAKHSFSWRNAAIVSASIVFVLLIGYRLNAILTPILVSLLLAYILDPLVTWVENRGASRLVVVIGVYIILAIVIALVIMLLIPAIVDQVIDFAKWLPKKITALNVYMKEHHPQRYSDFLQQAQKNMNAYASKTMQYGFDLAGSFLGSAFMIINLVVLIPLYTFFFLWRFDRITRKSEKYLPLRYRDRIIKVVRQINLVVANFFRGRLIVCFLIGLLTAIGFAIVKVPFAWPLGLATGILNFIPYMAPLIGLPATVLITYLTYHDILHPVLAVAVYGFFQLTDSFIFTPFIQGKMIGLHPITTIVVILVGSDLGGVFGLVLAIPTAAAVKILFNEFIRPVILDAADIHPESESRLSNDKKTDVASEGVSNG